MGNRGTASLGVILGAILLVVAGCGGQRGEENRAAATEPTSCEVTTDAQAEHRDGQHDRGLLRPRRRLRRGDQSADRRHAEGHRRRDVGVAAEHPAARGGHPSGGVLAGRHRGRRGQRQGGVRREPADRGADAAVSQLHPGDRAQRRRHQLDRRHARQAGVHRVAELRHRGDRQPHARGRRPRPGHGRRRRSAPNSARRSKA